MVRSVRRYLFNHAIALDQWANVWLGGHPDETISSRVGRNAVQGKGWALTAEYFINFLFLILGQRDHCRDSIELKPGANVCSKCGLQDNK